MQRRQGLRPIGLRQVGAGVGGGGLGSDTIVAVAGVDGLELVLTNLGGGVGNESFKWVIFIKKNGVLIPALDLRPDRMLAPQGSAGAPAYSYQGDATANSTGWFYNQSVFSLIAAVAGAQQMLIAAGSLVTMQADSAKFTLGSISQGVFGLFDTFNPGIGAGAGNVQLGNDGAIGTGASTGFIDLPAMTGPPTAAPTRTEANHRSIVVDSGNQKLWIDTTQAGSIWNAIGDNFKLGANLTDANLAKDVSNGSEFVLPPATLTANRTLTLNTTSAPLTQQVIRVTRFDAGAFTYAIVNGGGGGGTKLTFPVSQRAAADFKFDGTNWQLDRYWNMN